MTMERLGYILQFFGPLLDANGQVRGYRKEREKKQEERDMIAIFYLLITLF